MENLKLLLSFARKYRKFLNRDEPASWGGGMLYRLQKQEIANMIPLLTKNGYNPDIVFTRLSVDTKFPHRGIQLLVENPWKQFT